MFVSNSRYRILLGIAKSYPLSTGELRESIGRDPHPVLGRLEAAGAVRRDCDHRLELTAIGWALFDLAALERVLAP